MTTWIKKLRLYLLRRQLKSISDRVNRAAYTGVDWDYEFSRYCDQHADLIDRIAEIEKTL
jgi:hypothetical protein